MPQHRGNAMYRDFSFAFHSCIRRRFTFGVNYFNLLIYGVCRTIYFSCDTCVQWQKETRHTYSVDHIQFCVQVTRILYISGTKGPQEAVTRGLALTWSQNNYGLWAPIRWNQRKESHAGFTGERPSQERNSSPGGDLQPGSCCPAHSKAGGDTVSHEGTLQASLLAPEG